MAVYTNGYLAGKRQEMALELVRFQYQRNNGSWQNATVNEKKVTGNNVVVYLHIPPSGANDTITGIRFYDDNGDLAGQLAIKLVRQSNNSGLVKLSLSLTEA